MSAILAIAAAIVSLILIKDENKEQNIKTQNTPNNSVIPVENYYTVDLFHGTPDKEKLYAILSQQAFVIGTGNKFGSGVYWTTQFKKAQEYAGRKGGVVMGRLRCPSGQIVNYDNLTNSDGFKKWKKQSRIDNEGDAITAYCLSYLNKRFLRVGHTYVALAHRTTSGERVRIQGITILQ
jgi:hypothetical protein